MVPKTGHEVGKKIAPPGLPQGLPVKNGQFGGQTRAKRQRHAGSSGLFPQQPRQDKEDRGTRHVAMLGQYAAGGDQRQRVEPQRLFQPAASACLICQGGTAVPIPSIAKLIRALPPPAEQVAHQPPTSQRR